MKRLAGTWPVLALAALVALIPGTRGASGKLVRGEHADVAAATVGPPREIVVSGPAAAIHDARVLLFGGADGRTKLAELPLDARGRVNVSPVIHASAFEVVSPGYARRRYVLVPGAQRVALEPGGRLEGHVTASTGGLPLAARITVEREDGDGPRWEVTAFVDGAFGLDTLAKGAPYVARASLDGWESDAVRLAPGQGSVSITMRRVGLVHGRVTRRDEQTVNGAKVILAGSGVWPPREVDVAPDGTFAVSPLPAGTYELRAVADGLASAPIEGVLLAEGAHAELDLVLDASTALDVKVLDETSGEPIDGARVTVLEGALSFAARTAESRDGRARLEELRAVTHRMWVAADGYVPVSAMPVTPGGPVAEVRLLRTATLEGQVLDARGAPVEGARVDVVVEAPAGGLLSIGASLSGPAPTAAPVRLAVAGLSSTPGELGVTTGPVPPIPRASESAAPIPLSTAITTASDGSFVVEGVAPGRVRLAVSHAAYAATLGPVVTLAPGEHAETTVVLDVGGELEGRVVDARGFPVEGVRVELVSDREPTPRSALTGRDGAFAFGAALGEVELTAYPLDFAPATVTTTIEAGARVTQEIALTATVTAWRGRVLDAREFPVEGARVTVRAGRGRRPLVRIGQSTADGTFEVLGLPSPPYRVEVDHPAFAVLRQDVVRMEDEARLVLSPGAKVSGRVLTDLGDAPVASARVQIATPGALPTGTRRGPADTTVLEAVSGADGRFEVMRVPAGRYVLRVEGDELVPFERELVVAQGTRGIDDVTVEDVRLGRAGKVEGDVVDAFGHAVEGALVWAGAASDRDRATARTDSRGHFVLPFALPGAVTVWARQGDAEAASDPRQVAAGETTTGALVRLPLR